MNDIECPYCKEGQEINHDDGVGYEEDKTYQQQCGDCNKIFTYTVIISYYYDCKKAPCLNGELHVWQDIEGCPQGYYSNRKRCSCCTKIKLKNSSLRYNIDQDKWI